MPALKEEASLKGYTVVDAATVLTTHLTEMLKNNMAELLSYAEVQKLLKDLPKEQANWSRTSCRRMVTDLGHAARAADSAARARLDPRPGHHPRRHRRRAGVLAQPGRPWSSMSARGWRGRSARQNTSHDGYLPLIALSPKWEQAFAESLIGQGEERSLAMPPSKLSEFITAVRERFERAAREGEAPVLVTSAGIRPFVRSIVERFRAQTTVLSQAEIHPRARLKTVGSV